MSNSISGLTGNHSMMMQGMRGMKRPDPAQMANDLFSKLDTAGQGYIQKADLQSAFDKIPSSASSSATSSNVDELFSKLDTNSDGKVTKQEFSDTLKKVAEQLDNQFMSMRMNGGMQGAGMGGGMPPPPGGMPPDGDNGGLTKDQATHAAKEIGSSNSAASSALTNLATNFDQADTNQDGKVSLQELVAFERSTATSNSSTSSSTSASSSESTDAKTVSGTTDQSKVMMQIMKLMQAYNIGGDQNRSGLTTISVSA